MGLFLLFRVVADGGSVLVDAVEERVEQLDPVGLVVFDGVVALAEQDRLELEAGLVVGAGLADALEDAVGLGGRAQ